MSKNISRIDLHVHTHHSRTAGNWILDQIQISECYTRPMDVYRIAKSRGMDFVTITDHDVISGALQVAHQPDFFISEEISAFFPQDEAKVHILAFNINEEQHNEFQRLRFNIYELVPYLNEQNIVHALAHPYFKMGPTLSMFHIEQMLLMFEIFEVKNGGKQMMPDHLFEQILTHLTPEKIWQLADKHDMAPIGEFPWRKSTIAGSDDHGGIMISSPHTVTENVESIEDLLSAIKAGNCRAEGHGGSPLAVAHGAMAVGFKYLKEKKKSFDLLGNKLAWLLLDNIFEETRHHGLFSLSTAFVSDKLKNALSAKKSKKFKNIKKQIVRDLKKDVNLQQFLKGQLFFDHDNNIKFFASANNIVNQHLVAVLDKIDQKKSSPFEALKNISLLRDILPLSIPYFVAFKTEHSDRALMRESAEQLLPDELQLPRKVAIFSDNKPAQVLERDEINYLLEDEFILGYKPVYFTTGETTFQIEEFYTYASLATLKESPRYGLPPILQIAFDFSEQGCDKIFIDTLGPMGILGMLLGKLLKIPVISTYHETEVKALAEQSAGESSTFFKSIMSMFYAQIDQVRLLDVPSTLEQAILKNAKTDVRILGDAIDFFSSELTLLTDNEELYSK